MNIADFREYCLSFAGVEEKMPWTKQPEYANILVFSICGKWFAFVDIEKFEFCNLKCSPSVSDELQSRYEGIAPGWHMNHRHWISVYFNSDVPEKLVRGLVKKSYELVLGSLTAKERNSIAK